MPMRIRFAGRPGFLETSSEGSPPSSGVRESRKKASGIICAFISFFSAQQSLQITDDTWL
jgi:hypothetical protein